MFYNTQDIKSPLPIHQTLEMVGEITIGIHKVEATLNLNNYDSYLNFNEDQNNSLKIDELIVLTNTKKSWMIKASDFGDKKKFPVNFAMHSDKIIETFSGMWVIFSGIKTWFNNEKLELDKQIIIKEKSYRVKSITVEKLDDIAIEIKLSNSNSSIDLKEAKDIIFDMKMFFSLLVGSLVSVDYI
jgi:hypothetical protein